jgi:cytoskeletal protein CcmA (bactofilin family)
MFTKKKSDAPIASTVKSSKPDMPVTVIGKGINIEAAKLTGNESVRIDGHFIGEVDLNSSLILGETGVIEGNTHAKYIVVGGTVRGDVSCDTVLHISPTAKVDGDIRTNSIIVEEGGQLNGRYQVGETPSLAKPEVQPLLTSDRTDRPNRDRSYLEKSLEIVDSSSNGNDKDNKK